MLMYRYIRKISHRKNDKSSKSLFHFCIITSKIEMQRVGSTKRFRNHRSCERKHVRTNALHERKILEWWKHMILNVIETNAICWIINKNSHSILRSKETCFSAEIIDWICLESDRYQSWTLHQHFISTPLIISNFLYPHLPHFCGLSNVCAREEIPWL